MNVTLKHWLILVVLAITWGSSFILIKQGLVSFTPYQVGALRMTIASGLLAFWGVPSLRSMPKEKLWYVFFAGLTGNFVPMFLFPIAQTRVSSSVAGILDSLVPLFILVLGTMFFKLKGTKNQIIGVLVGFLGAILLIGFDGFSGENSFWHCMLIVFATILYAINSLILSTHLSDVPSFKLASALFTIWLIPAVVILLFSGFFQSFQGTPQQWESLGFVTVLGFFGTAAAMSIFYTLIKQTGSVFASMVTYLMPVVSVSWGLLVDEHVTLIHIIGFLMILSGIYLIQRNEKKQS